MGFAVFAIYVLNLFAMALWRLSYPDEAFFIIVALCITAFALKNICKDEYLTRHFAYQFKTGLAVFVYHAVKMCVEFLIVYFDEIIDKNLNLIQYLNFLNLASALLLLYGIVIIGIVTHIWFLYRNVKGLIYLSKNKVL
ncbi:MAG: hypothetical protein LBO72_02395 [Helicobacteraceae bacterium]|jgi:uncharacterized membrane protein|nr:hypothetical protein [Helicobacteraceae bacterium]